MNQALVSDWLQRALKLHRAGRLDEAGKLYAQLRRAAPKNFDALHLSGMIAIQQGRMSEAADLLAGARRLNPRSAVCILRQGVAFNGLARWAEGETVLREALALDQAMPEIWFHLGLPLRKQGRIDEAIAAYERALVLSPDYAEAHDRLGSLLAGARGHAEAEPHFRRATELDPKLVNSWSNLGICLISLGRLGEALNALDRALALNPNFDHAYAGRGLALSKCYRQKASVEAYGRALAINPLNHDARSARLYEIQYLSELSREAILREHLVFGEAVRRTRAAVHGGADPTVAISIPRPDPDRLLRIGFLSPDLHRHSVAYFLEPLLAAIDRRQFAIYLYHDKPTVDAMSERLKGLATQWRVVAGQSDDQVEQIIRHDAPDILIDLAGHTGPNRMPLYARRLAPIQMTYLGYPDTTGLPAMDYRLVDAITDPEGEADKFATEKLIRFAPTAWSYSPPLDAPEPAPSPGGQGNGVVFGCFNHFAKINEATLQVWGRLLGEVPGARLLLKGYGLGLDIFQAEIGRRLAAAGIDQQRVELAERTRTVEEHLASYARMDVALDTFPYNGTTTTCEAMWMGVPLVVLAGNRHAARVGMSLLTAVGHPEWIAADPNDYVRKARELAEQCARSSPTLARTGLRQAMRQSVLLDHPAQAERFGAALRTLWRQRVSG